MADSDYDQLKGELEELSGRLDRLTICQAQDVASLRAAIVALSERLDAAVTDPESETLSSEPIPPEMPVETVVTRTQPEVAPTPPVYPSRPPKPTPVAMPAPVTAQIPEKEKGSFEMKLGSVWLGRIGIAVLVTGLVLLGNFAYRNFVHDLPPIVRLLFLYLGAGGLIGTGIMVRKRESTAVFGEVVLAGGLAFGYWCTFAAHHVPRLRVVDSPILGALMVFAAAGAITYLSLTWRSRMIGIMGLVLASYATVLQPLGWLSSVSNLALALAGAFMMVRGRWAGPGVVAMLGSYISFLWWQILGSGGGDTEASLWFLPPVWAVFAGSILLSPGPGLEMSPRKRDFFATTNNVLFFLLFSGIWADTHGWKQYWLVAAIFGAVLCALGMVRRGGERVGGVFIAQGLAAVTLGMVLKLDGYQLALGLGLQAGLLAFAFSRHGGRAELIFGLGAAVGATFLTLDTTVVTPVWSNGLVAVLLMAAGVLMSLGKKQLALVEFWKELSRAVATLVLGLGCAVLLFGFCFRLDAPSPAAAAAGLLMLLTALRLDRSGWLPEARIFSMAFGGFAAGWLALHVGAQSTLSAGIAGVLLVGTHWLWQWASDSNRNRETLSGKLIEVAPWITALFVAASAFGAIRYSGQPEASRILLFGISAVTMASVGRYALKAPALGLAGALLLPAGIATQVLAVGLCASHQFIMVIASLGVTAVVGVRAQDTAIAVPMRATQALARFCAALVWLMACREVWPEIWGELMALTALVVGVPAVRKQWRSLYAETAAFLGIALSWFVMRAFESPWGRMDVVAMPPGWAVVGAILAFGFALRPASKDERTVRNLLLLLGIGSLFIWSTHWEVWAFGWKPVVVLWAAIGFASVSAGLWRRLTMLRHAGFAILALAILKLFVFDVWDLGAFVRVVAFLALGAVLVLLGFFYNRFADLIKKLFEAERDD